MKRPYVEEQVFQGRNFIAKPLQQGDYEACDFTDCNFSGSELSGTRFIECSFKGCNLEKADFRGAFNYNFDPAVNRVKGALFSRSGLDGLLGKFNIRIEP